MVELTQEGVKALSERVSQANLILRFENEFMVHSRRRATSSFGRTQTHY